MFRFNLGKQIQQLQVSNETVREEEKTYGISTHTRRTFLPLFGAGTWIFALNWQHADRETRAEL